jgi:predicted nuclease of predicted toxin-antitoxin system
VKIKLDEKLPERLVSVLSALGHDVDTVRREQLTGRADADVWSEMRHVSAPVRSRERD